MHASGKLGIEPSSNAFRVWEKIQERAPCGGRKNCSFLIEEFGVKCTLRGIATTTHIRRTAGPDIARHIGKVEELE
jgi:hypothetical protein